MFLPWLVDLNYSVSLTIGFTANIMVIMLSLKISVEEIQTYFWFTNIHAAIEAASAILIVLLKIVRFVVFKYFSRRYILSVNIRVQQHSYCSYCIEENFLLVHQNVCKLSDMYFSNVVIAKNIFI